MAFVQLRVDRFLPKPAKVDRLVQLTGTTTPTAFARLQVTLAADGVTSGSIDPAVSEAGVSVPKAVHDGFVAALNTLTTSKRILVTITTDSANPNTIVGFDFSVVTSTVAGASSTPSS